MPSTALLRAALLSPFKHPRPDAQPPRAHLTAALTPDPRHLAVYERVCGFATGRDSIPLTYPHALAFPLAMRLMTARDFPLPLLGLVHTSIDITQHRALHPGEELQLDVHVRKLAPHRRGTEATVVTEAKAKDGTPLWESSSTYLARHKTHGPKESRPRPEQPPTPHTPPTTETTWHLTSDLGRRYASVSGDRNPIHLHPLTARLFGFPRAIAHGMWTVARCLAQHSADDPAHVHAHVHAHAEFKAPILLPATVTYGSQGTTFELRGTKGQLHIRGEVTPR
ncbi:MaoC/PaaZ C-terminal domain-containing protein [Streptomyces sp. NPDC041068]|uniref:MaoC family dehydratase n=1 Tax=Streptomyces sp. NPDC041068 TaxID=3155130 RepID=UPI0033D056F3